MKLIHLHIPKTAGTSLRESIALAHPELGVAHVIEPINDPLPEGTDVISGHISYDDAAAFGDQIVTVLRHPVDRFVSIYFFWRELYAKGIEKTRKAAMAHHLSLLEFARAMDEPELCSELFNRMSWQLHSNYRLLRRFKQRSEAGVVTTDALIEGAMSNLRRFSVVGFQDRYGDFVNAVNDTFGMQIENRKVNVTAERSAMDDLSHAELDAILHWVRADMEVYARARAAFGGS
jgi:hypothetical protein